MTTASDKTIQKPLGKLSGRHILLTVFTCIVVIGEGYSLVIYSSVKDALGERFAADSFILGLFGSVPLIGMMLGALTLGFLSRKYGSRRQIAAMTALFAAATAVSGLARDPYLFAALRFIAGFGAGGAQPLAVGLLSEYAPEKHKNTLIALSMAGMQIGGVLAPLSGIVFRGSPEACMGAAAVFLIAVPFLWTLLPESSGYLLRAGKTSLAEKYAAMYEAARTAPATSLPERSGSAGIKKSSGFLLTTVAFSAAFFMGLLLIYGLNTWLPDLMRASGYELGSPLLSLLLLNLAALFGTFLLGKLADKTKPTRLIALLYFLAGAGLLLLSIKSGAVVTNILIAICGICVYSPQNLGAAYLASRYDPSLRATALGIANGVGRAGGIIGPSLGGLLLSRGVGLTAAFAVFAAAGIIACVLYIALGTSSTVYKASSRQQV
ncbi:MAG: MFS transporter [Oscillospiraceae bacterium]|nr:MFS transporter [Oscillospiraceae bacterium]